MKVKKLIKHLTPDTRIIILDSYGSMEDYESKSDIPEGLTEMRVHEVCVQEFNKFSALIVSVNGIMRWHYDERRI